jgi:tetratricopeptide (TPR) repeat protein
VRAHFWRAADQFLTVDLTDGAMIPPTGKRGRYQGWLSIARAVGAVVCVVSLAASLSAREQSEEFLQGLRERGLHELALDYLTQMRTSRLADAEFRDRIPYHRGITLIAQARQTPDVDERTKLFEKASRELEQFVAANPENPASAEALLELANVLVDQAKQLLSQAGALPDESTYSEQREKLLKEARGLLEESQPRYLQAEQFYTGAIDRMPKTLDPKTQGDLITQRQEFRGKLAQVSVLAGQAEFEEASTYPRDSEEFVQRNDAAAKQLASLYEKYSRWLVGFYARLYEGRCYQAVGDYQRALGCYEELISQSSVHPAFRKLISLAYGYQAQCLLAQGKHDAAIANLTGWLDAAQEEERRSPEWLFVRYELAEALREKIAAADTKQSEKRSLTMAARDAYRAVAAVPNDYQAAARTAAAALGPDERLDPKSLKDFAAAYQAGKQAMASVNSAKQALPSAAKNNPLAIPELRLQAEQGAREAREYFQLALTLVDDDTNLDEVNEVRYFLCWLNWDAGDFYQAAVFGDFLAQRYPDHPAAAASAKLALASYERLLQSAGQANGKPQDVEFEARKIAKTAEFITRRWPNTPTAETAYRVLISYAIRSGRIDEARDLFDQVAPATRPVLESQLGNALWARYLQLSQQKAAGTAVSEDLDKLRGDALRSMQTGFDEARKSGQVTEVSATAGLYLAQSLLSEGKFAEALALLEDPKVGPLTLVRERNAAAMRPEFIVEVYKAALRAYVSVTPPKIAQAIEAMKGLEGATAAGDDGQNDQRMRIYVSLAKALHEQLAKLRAAGQTQEVVQLSSAFGEFLDHIGQDQEESSWTARYWIAQTYLTMGESLRAGPAASRIEAEAYLKKARDAFVKLEAEAKNDPGVLPSPTASLAIAKQLGDCYRELGEFQKALDAYSNVLAEQESQLAVQQAAARTYQRWGEAGGGVKKLERAIYGGYQLKSTGKNRIWGWLRLATVAERAARSDPKYDDVFFEARLEAARSRYLIGTKSSAEDRQKDFGLAKQSVRAMFQLYPELGGERWRDQYEDLLKQIQKASGEKPSGLAEFKTAAK